MLRESTPRRVNGRAYRMFLTRCRHCGSEKEMVVQSLNTARSCGCRGLGIKRTGHPLRNCYEKMISRCEQTSDPAFADYGGRGIRVCDTWRKSFAAFVRDMGSRPSPRHTLDRIDNDGPYQKDNCRWATASQQAANRRSTRWTWWRGQRLAFKDLCLISKLSPKLIHQQVSRDGKALPDLIPGAYFEPPPNTPVLVQLVYGPAFEAVFSKVIQIRSDTIYEFDGQGKLEGSSIYSISPLT